MWRCPLASLQASCRRRAPGKPRGCVGPAQPRGARRGPPVVHGFSFGSPTFGSSPFGSPTLGSPPFGSQAFGSPAFGSPSFGSPAFHGCEMTQHQDSAERLIFCLNILQKDLLELRCIWGKELGEESPQSCISLRCSGCMAGGTF